MSAVGLRKCFGDKTVLDGIDLHVPEGTIFSLLGPNGAGKTTSQFDSASSPAIERLNELTEGRLSVSGSQEESG